MSERKRLLTFEQWADLYQRSGATAAEIEKEIGIPKVVFLRGVMPNGKRIPIPYKYETGLFTYLNKRIAQPHKPLAVELGTPSVKPNSILAPEELASKLSWVSQVRHAQQTLRGPDVGGQS